MADAILFMVTLTDSNVVILSSSILFFSSIINYSVLKN